MLWFAFSGYWYWVRDNLYHWRSRFDHQCNTIQLYSILWVFVFLLCAFGYPKKGNFHLGYIENILFGIYSKLIWTIVNNGFPRWWQMTIDICLNVCKFDIYLLITNVNINNTNISHDLGHMCLCCISRDSQHRFLFLFRVWLIYLKKNG